MQKGTITLKDILAISYKAKNNLAICAPEYLPNSDENLCTHKTLHINIYSSFIHNFPKLEATKMSLIGECVNKLVHSYMGILFSDKE